MLRDIGGEVMGKYSDLKKNIKQMGCLAVAFSGGVDSTFLLKVANQVLSDWVIAIIVKSNSFPEKEFESAVRFCQEEKIEYRVIEVDELAIDGFAANPVDRCYICKRKIFGEIKKLAESMNIHQVVEGTNSDDEGDYRPGMRAIRELGVKSPLKEVGLTKAEIRELSQNMGLRTWNKPSLACLSSRFVYGEQITKKKLKMVEDAEEFLHELGYRQVRVRIHGENMARIEPVSEDISKVVFQREEINSKFEEIGFKYVTLDLKGYRTGSMNEVLLDDKNEGNS